MARSEWRGHPCSLLIVAVDGFESFHLKSDDAPGEVLDALVRELQEEIRPWDVVGRTGPAELSIMLPETGVPEVESLFDGLSERVAWYFTMSGGVACFPVHGAHVADLTDKATAALAKARDGGGNALVRPDEALPGVRGVRAVL